MHNMTTPPIFRVLTRSVRAEEIPTISAVTLVSNPTGSSSGSILTQFLNVGIEVVSEVASFLTRGRSSQQRPAGRRERRPHLVWPGHRQHLRQPDGVAGAG
jgi:hypothetical protein